MSERTYYSYVLYLRAEPNRNLMAEAEAIARPLLKRHRLVGQELCFCHTAAPGHTANWTENLLRLVIDERPCHLDERRHAASDSTHTTHAANSSSKRSSFAKSG
jgi:hypothetical protein